MTGGEREVARGRTKSTSWQVPSTAYRYTSDLTAVRWDVIVLRELETGEVLAVSPMSEPGFFRGIRRFSETENRAREYPDPVGSV